MASAALEADGARLEFAHWDGNEPPLVFLHEGLGSLSLWRGFAERIARASRLASYAYSRRGYGRSDPVAGPRGVDYMHHEARVVLPAVLERLGVAHPVLVGHSDGASIALIHAAMNADVRGLVLMAPHVFVEDRTVAGIEAVRREFETTDLPTRLARHHADAHAMFRGWSGIWLDPAFRSWNIEDVLPAVRCPVLLIQGEDDAYGTSAQLDAVARGVRGPVEACRLPACGHSPHREREAETTVAMRGFLARLVGTSP
jgi:pimeloyl-ACP methyl ester carboxylesterase